MKKSILVAILIISSVFCAFGQSGAGSQPVDLVLLLDTSSGMSSSYDRVNDYITGPFLSEFLRVGDTFHLIAYSGKPRLDAARRIQSRGDFETIIGRILLQYPVESGNDLRAAIAFAEQYISALPARPKKIVLVGTGGSDANSLVSAAKQRLSSRNVTFDFVQVTPGQPLANLPTSGRAAASSQTAPASPTSSTQAQRPGATGTQPATRPPSQQPAGQTAQPTGQTARPSTTSPSQTQGTQTQTTQQPQQADRTQSQTQSQDSRGATDTRTSSPGTSPSTGTQAAGGRDPSQPSTSGQGTQDSSTPRSSTGDDYSRTPTDNVASGGTGANETGRPETADSGREQSTQDSGMPPAPKKLLTSSGDSWASSIPLIIGFIILALIILFIIIFLASRRLGSRPNRVMASVSSAAKPEKDDLPAFVDHSKDLASYAAVQSRQRTTPYTNTSRPIKPEAAKPAVINPTGPLLLNLFVEDQNTAIGKRNVHSLKSGYSLSVGGGKSDYLIFLVRIPSNIGEIRRSGSQCTFIPRKPKYFPDLGSNELRDCVNKTIRIVSDKNYEIRFRFEMYEDPLIALNRILMSVKVPG